MLSIASSFKKFLHRKDSMYMQVQDSIAVTGKGALSDPFVTVVVIFIVAEGILVSFINGSVLQPEQSKGRTIIDALDGL